MTVRLWSSGNSFHFFFLLFYQPKQPVEMDCIVPKAENTNEREYNSYLPTMVPSFSSFMEPKESTISAFDTYPGAEQRTVATYDAKGKSTLKSEDRIWCVALNRGRCSFPIYYHFEKRGSPEYIHGQMRILVSRPHILLPVLACLSRTGCAPVFKTSVYRGEHTEKMRKASTL